MTTTAPQPLNQPEFFRRMNLPLPTFTINIPDAPTDPDLLEQFNLEARQDLRLEERDPAELQNAVALRYYRALDPDESEVWHFGHFQEAFSSNGVIIDVPDEIDGTVARTYENRWASLEDKYPGVFDNPAIVRELRIALKLDAFDAVEIWVAGPGDYAAIGVVLLGSPVGTAEGQHFVIARWGDHRMSEADMVTEYQEVMRRRTVYTISGARRLNWLQILLALVVAAGVAYMLHWAMVG